MVRNLRNRHACLQTDHVSLMKKIEKALHNLHEHTSKPSNDEEQKHGQDIEMGGAVAGGIGLSSLKESIPFLWIGEVSSGSPAEESGFQNGDAVVKFGNVT